MQIQRILFIFFFVLLFIVALMLTTMSFFASRSLLQEEIGRNLTHDATMLMEEVDMILFESFQDLHSWSRQDVIQEARFDDVDKRLSQFLNETKAAYKGRFRDLFYINDQGRIIAASSPELIGRIYEKTPDWIKIEVPNGEIVVEDPAMAKTDAQAYLAIRTTVQDRYSKEHIGQLYGLFDLQQLFYLLDKTGTSSTDERFIALLDNKDRTIAASANLRQAGHLLKSTFAEWKPRKGETLFVHKGEPITKTEVLVGHAQTNNYLGYERLGWSILIIESTAKAFLPVQTLWTMFTVVLLLTLLLAFFASHWLSFRIAKPLIDLTQWVRTVRHFEKPSPPKVDGTSEVRELASAFTDMLLALESSREHVIQTAKLAVVGEMAAIMAHEVRTPLGILSTSAQWLQREHGLSPEGKEMTQFILDETDRLKKLVTTLLECARPREPQMQAQNLHEIINHTVDLLAIQASKKNVRIDQQLTAQNPIIQCDNELLTQVFLNLIHNAIQIVPEMGRIRIKTLMLPNSILIEIADNGPGIAQEDYARLFDPFFTKRPGGVGLGLTVSRQIIMTHHGKINAARSEWGGARFTIELPLNQD